MSEARFLHRLAQLLAVLLLLTVCFSAWAGGKPKVGVLLTEEDDGGSFTIKVGEEVIILLDIPRTRGYDWYVQEIDRKVFQLAGRQPADRVKGIEGRPDQWALRFRSVTPGKTKVELAFCRFADCAETTRETFSVTIQVAERKKRY